MDKPAPILSLPLRVDEVPETGRRVTVSADALVRAALARAAGLVDLPRFEAIFDLTRHGRGGLHVAGTISATVRQTCVVTLDEIDNDLDEAIDLTFVAGSRQEEPTKPDGEREGTIEAPESLVNGTVDLGAIAVEFLMLAIDPYPRKSDAVFVAPAAEPAGNHPFAALAALKKRDG
jgi:uncharacterized metal-binding protein YceD (DUF177 family)